jgi:hypothetical protein
MASLLWQILAFWVAVVAAVAAALALPSSASKRGLIIFLMIASVFGPVLLVLLDPRTLSGPPAAQTESKEFNKVADASPVVPPPQASESANSKNVTKSPGLKADEKYPDDNTLGYLDGPPLCAADNADRRGMIVRISDLKTRDFEYGTLILDLLNCKSFGSAVDVASKITDLKERDGALTKIAMSAIEGKAYQGARRAIYKQTSMQVRDLLTSILMNEMRRPPGYDPDTTTYATTEEVAAKPNCDKEPRNARPTTDSAKSGIVRLVRSRVTLRFTRATSCSASSSPACSSRS